MSYNGPDCLTAACGALGVQDWRRRLGPLLDAQDWPLWTSGKDAAVHAVFFSSSQGELVDVCTEGNTVVIELRDFPWF